MNHCQGVSFQGALPCWSAESITVTSSLKAYRYNNIWSPWTFASLLLAVCRFPSLFVQSPSIRTPKWYQTLAQLCWQKHPRGQDRVGQRPPEVSGDIARLAQWGLHGRTPDREQGSWGSSWRGPLRSMTSSCSASYSVTSAVTPFPTQHQACIQLPSAANLIREVAADLASNLSEFMSNLMMSAGIQVVVAVN